MGVGDDERALRDLLHAVDAIPLPPIDVAHTTRRARRRRAPKLVATGVAGAIAVVAVFGSGVAAGSGGLMVGATTARAGLQGETEAASQPEQWSPPGGGAGSEATMPSDSTTENDAYQDTGALFSGDGCSAARHYSLQSADTVTLPSTSFSAVSANVDAAAGTVSGRLTLGTPTARADEAVIVLYDPANAVAAVSYARLAETVDGAATYTGTLDRCTDGDLVRAGAVVRTDHGVEVTPLTAVD